MPTAVTTPNAPAPVGPYSQAMKAQNFMYISGQLGINPETGEFASPTIEGQTKQVLDNVVSVLEAGGYTTKDVVKTTIYVSDPNNFGPVNDIYAKYFPPKQNESDKPPPARAFVAVQAIPKNGLVEVEAIACHD